jgi:hypothetical protein
MRRRFRCSPPRLLQVFFAAVLIWLLGEVSAGENDHRYKDSERVVLWVNKVGPYNNPQVSRALEQHPCFAKYLHRMSPAPEFSKASLL